MFNTKTAAFSTVAAAFALLPVAANAAAPTFKTFGAVEYRSNPAALVDNVRAGIAAQVPAGSSVESARSFLSNAGAHCKSAKDDGAMRCRYYGEHYTGDVVIPVTWTVDVAASNDKVTALTVERVPAGD